MIEKLLPCPFCGELPAMYTGRPFVVHCDMCGSETSTFNNAELAAKRWNTRVGVAPASRTSPLLRREQMARDLFAVDAPSHREWADAWLDERERYLCLADAAIANVADAPIDAAISTSGEISLSGQFERIIKAINYDGSDINSLTVGEIRRALP